MARAEGGPGRQLCAGDTGAGSYALEITPERAGWRFSGLRVLALAPGASHTLDTGAEELVVLPLEGAATVTVDGDAFALDGRAGVFDSLTDVVYHGPSMAAPGYDLYYLNVMAGPGERAWRFTDDPDHAWVRATWDEQEIDPRLPLTAAPMTMRED